MVLPCLAITLPVFFWLTNRSRLFTVSRFRAIILIEKRARQSNANGFAYRIQSAASDRIFRSVTYSYSCDVNRSRSRSRCENTIAKPHPCMYANSSARVCIISLSTNLMHNAHTMRLRVYLSLLIA